MHRFVTACCAIAVVVPLLASSWPGTAGDPSTRTDDRPAVSIDPAVTITGGAAAEQARVDESLALFRSVGLELPDIEIVFHDQSDAAMTGCKGHYGLFQPQYEPWRVLVCSEVPFVLTHELAHAWARANLDDAGRTAYTAARGFETWTDPAVPWREQAVEDAAFVVQKNLMTGYADLESDRWVELVAAYELLTGVPSPLLANT